MPLHDRAWKGANICIVNSTPLVPMRMEQAIASALPSVEVQLSSFEQYDQAYDFCKNQKNISFLILGENWGSLPVFSVFRELSEPAESAGLPCFGIITYESQESALVAKTVGKNPKLLDYLPESSLLTPKPALVTLRDLWTVYSERFETLYIPKPLEASLLSFYSFYCGEDCTHFTLRATTLIQSQMNISWLEAVAVKWHPIVNFIASKEPSLLSPLAEVTALVRSVPSVEVNDLTGFLESAASTVIPVPAKITACVRFLENCRKKGILEQELSRLPKSGGIRPALVRILERYKDNLVSFAHDAAGTSDVRKAV